jgi:CheY-like chemotaxis protein
VIIRWKPDLLVSDIGMPHEDGFALMRRVRALSAEEGGTIPAVALTAFARTQDRLKVLSAGFQMHVPKPIEQLELLTVVASLTKRL